MSGRSLRSALTAAAVAATAVVMGCGDGDESATVSDERAATYVDDRWPRATTAATKPLPGGDYPDPIVDGNAAVQADEAVRDYQESLAEGSGGGACSEMSTRLQRRIGGAGSCAQTVGSAIGDRRSGGRSGYRPSKILAVQVRGVKATVTVQDGDREPFTVSLAVDGEGSWKLIDVDLDDRSGLRPFGEQLR